MPSDTTPLDPVRAYHERSKHHFQRYAAGPGGLDWATQPDPFRRFAGSARLTLPLLGDRSDGLRFADLYEPDHMTPQALTRSNIAALLELSFGLSAWKQYLDSRWALRCNPSSGNLHPTEAYLVVASCAGIEDGVYHYLSHDHVLEQRCRFALPPVGTARLLPAASFLLGMSSIHWREAWKYGERAFRYCQHDAGHALAAVRYAAATLGWQARLLADWSDDAIATLLGLDREMDFGDAEREHPDLILEIRATSANPADNVPPPDGILDADAVRGGHWQGLANALSPQHRHDWPAIDAVAHACRKPQTREAVWHAPARPAPIATNVKHGAAEVIRQRRSAQAFDGVTAISATTLCRLLDMTLPRAGVPPWDALPWAPRVHLLLFVHRVDGLAPGLYLFLRNGPAEAPLRAGFSSEFEWAPVAGCPAHFALFRLVRADARNAARALSCHQDIAADGAFSLAMLAAYETGLGEGPWNYRRLFWEAGMIGQVLYLEAEAAGARGTGIGCYFDDAVHELLGLRDRTWQSMYHFTVGSALADSRLQTLPAYAHLRQC